MPVLLSYKNQSIDLKTKYEGNTDIQWFKDVNYSRKKINFKRLAGSRACLCRLIHLQLLKFERRYVEMENK